MVKFDKDINCHTCKYGYFEDVSDEGYHNLCGKRNCYLCAKIYGKCADYERGTPPEGKEGLYPWE
nr:MAG TPA: hypothetical protein [Caudoviricetes sp.]